MSGRMDRVKKAIASTLTMVKEQYEKQPNSYIAGFHNGLSLADHHINMREGDPKFLDVKADRMAMKAPDPLEPQPRTTFEDEQEYEHLMDKVLTAARMVAREGTPTHSGRHVPVDAFDHLQTTIQELDKFIDAKLGEAGQSGAVSTPDAGTESQESASLSPAASEIPVSGAV